jgi:hypothetical protein
MDLYRGHSNLRLGESMSEVESIYLHYMDTDSGQENDAHLTFVTDDNRIQRFVVLMPEDNLDRALRFSQQILYSVFDFLSFLKRIPIQVRQIEIFHAPSGDFLRTYVTMPFTIDRDVDLKDLFTAQNVPKSMRPLMRLFRESINSSNPHHRFLCLYRIREGLQEVQERNNEYLKAKGKTPTRTRIKVPDNELTRRHFPKYAGKKVGAYFEFLREEYRNFITHFEFDEKGRLVLDPSEVTNVHRLDLANVVLEQIMRNSIVGELRVMQESGLR